MNERQIFEAALDIADPVRREVFLSQACGADGTLRQRVDALLTAHAAASQFLETPAVQQLNTPPDSSGEDTMQLPPSHVPAEGDSDAEIPSGPDISFLSPSTKPGSIGTLGHYEILNVLGQGAFGIVFRAFDEKLHRHVAIKTMSVQMAATSPPRKRFLREARAAAAIRHENVVQVYSVEEQPLPYLVMEFIDGETLQQKQRDHGPLEVPELLHIGRQLAAGLAAAHAQSLIHRDVKPGNILLEKGAEQKVKITDFGLARAADDASLTRSGMISGTPLYMAPEQALGQTLDHRSDLFSLGSVLYELATGRPPFRAPTTVAVLRRVVDDTPRPIQEIIPECPDWLVAIISKLLSKQPDDRYQSAKEVADLLARCQSELQLTGQVTCVAVSNPASGAASAPRVATTPATPDGTKGASVEDERARFGHLFHVPRHVFFMIYAVAAAICLPPILLDTWPPVFQFLPGLIAVLGVIVYAVRNDRRRASSAHRLPKSSETSEVSLPPDGSAGASPSRPSRKTVLLSLLLGVLVMFPILFGKHLSTAFNAWLARPIPLLPATELTTGLNFDGKDDHVEFAPVDWSYPQFTIEAFVTSTPRSDNGITVSLTSGGSPWEFMELYDGPHAGSGQRQSGAQIMGKTPYATAYGPLTPGVRQHRALVFDGSHMHYYINGLWQGKRRAEAHEGMMWKLKQLRLGSDGDGKKRFEGQIDQVRISKVARYTDNFAPVTSVASDDQTLALYDFAEGSGDVLKDISGHGHDGKIVGATWVNSANGGRKLPGDSPTLPKAADYALDFDGIDDLVRAPFVPWSGKEPLTMEAYVTPRPQTGQRTLMQTRSPAYGRLYLHDDKWRAIGAAVTTGNGIISTSPITLDQSVHMAAVWDGQGMTMFIDGHKQPANGFAIEVTEMKAGTTLEIGAEVAGHQHFAGLIDEIRFSNVVRYEQDFTPVPRFETDPHTLALYHCDEGKGDVLQDSSGRGLDGKIIGATWVKANAPPPAPRRYSSGEWIDVLSLIDPPADKFAVSGMTGQNDWRREDGDLVIAKDEKASKLLLPLDSAWSAFECELEFTRRAGRGGLNLNIPTTLGECPVVVDHPSGPGGVFLGARNKGVILTEGTQLETGKRTTLRIEVRREQNADRISVDLNDKNVGQWSGDRNQIGRESNEGFPVGRRLSLWLPEGGNEFAIHRLRVRMLDGETATTLRPVPGTLPTDGQTPLATTGWHGWPADAPAPAIAPFDAEQAQQHQAAWAKYLNVPVEYTNSLGMKFRLIPPGEFLMGSTKEVVDAARLWADPKNAGWLESLRDEAHQHQVILTRPSYLAVNETTQADYEKVMGVNPSGHAPMGQYKANVAGIDTSRHPVERVNWNDVGEFCSKLSELEKITPSNFETGETVFPHNVTSYRLPTEAEWENACRAGTSTRFWGGDKDEVLFQTGWFNANSNGRTHAVGELKANPYGLCDMHGNVWEWVEDWMDRNYYEQCQDNLTVNPSGPNSAKSNRILRGGSVAFHAVICRSAHRGSTPPSVHFPDQGFRVSLSVDAVRQALKLTGPAIPLPAVSLPAQANWTNLFDGTTTTGWKALGPFKVAEGLLTASEHGVASTEKSYDNFELEFEWRVVAGGNSGVYYRANPEQLGTNYTYPGTEFQLLDNALHPDGKNPKTSAGALWGVIPAEGTFTRPAGEWNTSRIVARGPLVEHWVNDQKVLSYDMDSEAWRQALAGVRNRDIATNAASRSGCIAIQGYTGEVAFRSIRVREIPATAPPATASKFPPLAPGWFERVSQLPPEEQVKEVAAELKRRNPEWDEKLEHEVRDGVVYSITLDGAHLADIMPLSVFTHLEMLACFASKPSRITDLSPLAGLKQLRAVTLVMCQELQDLTPLRDLPLTFINLQMSSVSDLSPLAGKPIKSLYLGSCGKLKDISPLRGAPLTTLAIYGTGVSDLAPLRDSKVETLNLNSPSFDADVICRWPLKSIKLSLDYQQVSRDKLLRLKEIKTLETIDDKPVAEFWKEFDAAAQP